ncbi:hypothetical protein SAMN05443667_101266 [Flavobacterium gillisiae]|uniref:Uncharacterized protein n=1 Tax=Flavobacterium gillisiae TaxID=150146 RepID=A0A1H3WVU6_9FLAO|nr:hypothetical protein [Flavobacterium gillisiae]SDZ91285.1 hypothetical protein SAMN05443667_101266 [Flavobacterium gillisiae]
MPFYQTGTSKLKMVALMPPNEKNITWYSPIQENKKHSNTIMNGMLTRFVNGQEAAKRVVVYQFYENGALIHEIKRP